MYDNSYIKSQRLLVTELELITELVVKMDEPGLVNKSGVVNEEPLLTNKPGVLRISRCLQTSRGCFG